MDVNSPEAEEWSAHMARLSEMEFALRQLYDDCADYIRTNNLFDSQGRSAIWNKSMRDARKALRLPTPG